MTAALPSRLVTVTSSDYLPGTRVMLDSFLTHNRWFDGRIIVVHDGMTHAEQEELSADFKSVAFCTPSTDLKQAVARLVAAYPHLRSRAARFLSLQCFWLPDDEGDLLFCDSDLLFLRDIRDAVGTPGDLLACPDKAQTQGHGRDRVTMAEGDGSEGGGHRSFNAGLMVMRAALLQQRPRHRISALLEPEEWSRIASDHTDQAVLNICFGRDVRLLPERYNLLVGHAGAIRGATDGAFSDAEVLHFNGPAKPWLLARHPGSTARDGLMIRAYEEWFAAHVRHLTQRHFGMRRQVGEAQSGAGNTPSAAS